MFSQTDCITGDCSKSFKQQFFNVLSTQTALTYYKQSQANNGFPQLGDVYYQKITNPNLANPNVDETCHDNPDDCIHDGSAFKYHVYYPDIDYSTCKPPALIMFHGGGFADCLGNFNGTDFVNFCKEFAKRGYVVFNVEYRTGRLADPTTGLKLSKVSAQQSLAIYRAMQDSRGAVRTIIQRQEDQDLEGGTHTYEFDVDKIFLGGTSAGSILALAIAYTPTAAMIGEIFPTPVGGKTIVDALGPINASYYANTADPVNHPNSAASNIVSHIKGVLNCWGEVFFPMRVDADPASFFSTTNPIPPMIAFHGLQDNVNYIGKYYIKFATSNYKPAKYPDTNYPNLNNESLCTLLGGSDTYSLENVSSTKDLISLGSYDLYKILKNQLGIETEFYSDCQMMHGVKNFPNDPLNPNAGDDFGTGATGKTPVYAYIVQRATTFFQGILSGTISNPANAGMRDKFVECENNRIKCTPVSTLADNPTTCPAPPADCILPETPLNQ